MTHPILASAYMLSFLDTGIVVNAVAIAVMCAWPRKKEGE